jgi:N-methylhydantoinase A
MITLAADVGGTFTDVVLVDTDRGMVLVDKVPTGKRGSAEGIVPGITRIAARAGCKVSDIGLFVHGFTVATNAFLMRAGARAVLVTTQGFGDVLEIGGQMRPKTYALIQQKPEPVIPRALVVEARERIDAFGDVVERLTPDEVKRVAATVAEARPEAVAVSLVFSFLNPDHEVMLAEALRAALPGVPVYCAHDVNPQLEEWPRASTTAMAAYVGPVVTRYIDQLEGLLADIGFRGALQLMRSDGGVATARATRENPAHMLTSGLAGGVTAAVELCRRIGVADAITLDVGGTSADLAAITGGVSRTRMSRVIDGQPVRLPTIDVETISNGGGSIAWVDRGGALKVGPLSAGAVPGPACYGQGGTKPTVTDAAVVLGWLAPEDYLGGDVTILPKLAHEAVTREIATPLGVSVEAAAFGIIRVANAMLVQSIRSLCVERGIDVRPFSLVAFGGAGPLYGGMIARDLGMREVVVPRHPGVFAAEGLLAADIRHMAQAPFRAAVTDLSSTRLKPVLQKLKDAMAHELDADGVPEDRRAFRVLGDLRYIGQFHEILCGMPDYLHASFDADELAAIFHTQHAAQYGHADPLAPVEIVNLRIEATGKLDTPQYGEDLLQHAGPAGPVRRRKAVMAQGEVAVDVPIYERGALASGQAVAGPAILVQRDSTTVVFEGQVAEAGALGVVRIREMRP